MNDDMHSKPRSVEQGLSPEVRTFRPADQKLQILAHQGSQYDGPGNSPKAIAAAIGRADVVEMDLYTADREGAPGGKEVIVVHPEGYYLFAGKGRMENEKPFPLSFDEAAKIEARGAKLIETLDHMIDIWVEKSRDADVKSLLHLELKGPGSADVAVPILQRRVAAGDISYDDFMITGLSYAGDAESLIETARRLDPNIKLVLVFRGEDLTKEGFDGWDGLLAKARELDVTMVNGMRRHLTRADIRRIEEAGFESGCYHARTTDELEAALALDAGLVAADDFRGASVADYPDARPKGSPNFEAIHDSGFYKLRDYIWELGWHLEAVRGELPPLDLQQSASITNRSTDDADAMLVQEQGAPVALRLCENGEITSRVLDFSDITIPPKFLGLIDQKIAARSFGEFLEPDIQVDTFQQLTDAVLAEKSEVDSTGLRAVIRGLSFNDIVRIGNGEGAQLASSRGQQLEAPQLELLDDLSREFLTRTGRVVGMLAFTALNPRFGPKENYKVAISSDLCRDSKWAQMGAREQVKAQSLRSGKYSEVTFL